MKILPDYLIQVLPELEDAIEELRLSIVDHAYELLQCLDLDELSIDQIRQKLELCELKVSNMTSEWLPNGRFYRLYQSIKHNRSRKNAIKAIAKSGGQFEGLWSNNFSNKTEYNYNKIQVARHYELSSNADGYFFVSGDTVRDKKGTVVTSAAKALTTDILINQSLPAGYTYLYIPWPRPHYPADSDCFYNVNMLMYDRLHYSTDCEYKWALYNQTEKIYYCADNSYEQCFCKVTDSNTLYGNSASTCYLPFDNTIKSDCPFVYDSYSENVPASTKYDWYNGKGTPWRASYWFDYHYMNKMGITLPDENSAGTWPITESGTYYDIDDDPTDDPSEAITYKLNNNCLELSDSKSYFPTKCYMRDRLKSTMPNRLQKFEFKDYNYIKIEDSKRYYITLESYEGLYEKVVSLIYSAYNYQISRDIIRNYINSVPVELPYFTKYGLFNNARLTFENHQAAYEVQCNFSYRVETIYRYVLEDDASIEHSIDSNEYIVPCMTYSDAPGAYRCDVLHNGTVLNIHESLHHSKIYRPFWCENTPWSEMISSKYKSGLERSDGETVNHSLYNWLHLKQISNRPQLTQTNGDNCPVCVGTIEYNKPPVSCITFYSEHRPTHSTLDNIYLAFATPYADGDHAQKALSDDLSENVAYYYGSTNRIEYDPELYYTIITINGDTTSEVPLQPNQIRAYIEGNPATGEFNINRNSDTHDTVEYYTYKTSTVHKLWFSENHEDVLLDQTIYLYNSVGSTELGWFSENTINLTYNVIGIFKENGIAVPYNTGVLYPEIIDHNYVISASSFVYNNNPVTAAYVLFTVHASDGAIPQFDHVQLNKNVTLLHGSLSALYIDLGHVEYHDAPLPPPVYGIPMGGMMSPTSHSTYYVQELPEQITVDNITLSGFMVPMSVEDTVYGNPNATSQNIVINDNDVNGILYDTNGEPITDQSKLYVVVQLNGTGSGSTPEEDDISKPLMLKAIQDNSSVAYGGGSLPYTYSYSMDGTTWISYSLNTVIPLNKDEVVYFKRKGHTGSGTPSTYNHHKFTMTGEIEAYHNVNSMLIEGDFETADTLTEEYCGIYMFAECASLTRAPLIPATTLAEYCYYCMFYMCTRLVTAPELPATTLARFCYSDMFHGCTNLVNAPELPVLTLLKGCYNGMFYDCPSLVNAPLLPATSLVEACYKYMFGACTNLSYIRIFATDISASSCLTYWLQNASSTGDIYCVNGVNYPTGDDGIPSGWTRHDI
jgi:hypothetical protein